MKTRTDQDEGWKDVREKVAKMLGDIEIDPCHEEVEALCNRITDDIISTVKMGIIQDHQHEEPYIGHDGSKATPPRNPNGW